MKSSQSRRVVVFRLDVNLLERLKAEAKRENRSVNNLVETILMDAMYRTPNAETLEAIEEARSAKDKEAFDSVESLMNELMK